MSDAISIHQIYLSKGHDFKGRFNKGRLNHEVVEVDRVECVQGRGLVGDRYFDYKEDFKGQISLMSMEAIEAVERDLGVTVADKSTFRRNVLVSGVDLTELVGLDFRIGDVELRGVEQCTPCFWMDEAIGPGAFDALEGRGGLRCRILKSGVLKVGTAEVSVLAP